MDVDALISAVYRRPSIWDKRRRDHANRNTINSAWKEISQELRHDETALKNKWKSLRDYFSTEYNERAVARSGDGANNLPTSKWLFFQQLLFLKDIISPRVSFDSLELDVDEVSGDQRRCHEHEADNVTENSAVENQEPDALTDMGNSGAYEPGPSHESCAETSWTDKRKNSSSTKRKRDNMDIDFNKQLLDIEKKKLKFCEEKQKNNDLSKDADFLFIKSLYPYLKMVPEHLKLSARGRLQSVLQEFIYPPSTSHQFRHIAHSYDSVDRTTPSPSYQIYSTSSTPHSFTSNTTEPNLDYYQN